jgi:hypothetical protein
MNKENFIHVMQYYSTLPQPKEREILPPAKVWMILEDIMA